MPITKDSLIQSIDGIQDQHVEIIYYILQAFIQTPQLQYANLNPAVTAIEPVTLSLEDSFAAIPPLAQPLDYKQMREIALGEQATRTIQEMN